MFLNFKYDQINLLITFLCVKSKLVDKKTAIIRDFIRIVNMTKPGTRH